MVIGREAEMGRRRFVASLAAIGVPLAIPEVRGAAAFGSPPIGRTAPDPTSRMLHLAPLPRAFPQNDPERVQGVVGASHGNLDRVRELVLEQPALAKASWDWGFGDWETALGAASHTGRREIAAFLIAHGARPTIFSAAMLGEVDTVRAFLTADPSLFRLHGPHGISLTRHALAGGADAERVLDYLRDTFGPDEEPFGVEGDDAMEARYGGRYRLASDPPAEMAVGVRNGWLMIGMGEQPTARVLRVEEDVFHPTGAPAVRLRFHVEDGRATSITIEDGAAVVRGERA